jgi:hypothetical protein
VDLKDVSVVDGYLRLGMLDLLQGDLHHVLSGMDEPVISALGERCGYRTEICGYTEWGSRTHPHLTIGWDWRLAASCNGVRCVRVGLPRSNLMLIGFEGGDLGGEATEHVLSAWVDTLPWSAVTRQSIEERHAH